MMNRDESVAFAKKFLEDIISFFGENVTVEAVVEEEIIMLSANTTDLNSILIGRGAETLRSLQYLVSTALRNQDAELSRVNIDIAEYKKQRDEKTAEQAREWIEEVRRSGDSYVARINAADRRIVHRVAAEYEDIRTYSEGEGRDRRIIIAQASS